jgi:RNA polymerase sigma-70 factor (ECF subfamily)
MTGETEIVSAQLSDVFIIEKILLGEKKLFETIMRRYNQRLYRVGMAVLASDAEVEDAMQTAYISAFEHLAQFEKRASFATWLTRIMLNQCYEQKRRRRLFKNNTDDPQNFINIKTPANILAEKELSGVLERAIDALPEKYRLVFVLREMADMSVRETSEALNIGEPNVKVRLNRAKSMLRTDLSEYVKDHVYHFHLSRCDRIVTNVMNSLQI